MYRRDIINHIYLLLMFVSNFHVYFQFRVQNQLAFKLTHRMHMTSDFYVFHMHGELRR
jgi:hypothetical protein